MIKAIKIFNSIFVPFAVILVTVVFGALETHAEEKVEYIHKIEYKKVDRTKILEEFLNKYNSPLAQNADKFIEVADKYNLDYRMLPAISCVESTCGKFLIQESHNPFGWGGGYTYFDSYDEAIEKVAEGLDEIYLSRGLDTPEKIAPIYTPPNHYNWLRSLGFFMNQMDQIALEI